ncbi:MAG: endonuclease/exonuclease/phosphatase family protein [Verrucomicrobia bacterium]|nr:endonuclease/exonuclease/phosphatase family protein [Verrucomicrobiota bacterium]
MKIVFSFLKPLALSLTAVFLLIGCVSAKPERSVETFRVMTFNIHHGVGIDGKLDLQRIADLIKEEKADLVALQEVDKGIERSNKLDVGAELGRMTGMSCVFSNNYSFAGGEYGNAILSRFKVESRDHRLLPKTDSPEQRGWLKAVVNVNGKKLSFWNTHIDHRRDDTERLQAIEKFTAWVKEEKLPVIFCGDFNDLPGSRTHQKLKEHFDDTWEKAGQGAGYTIPVKNPKRRIDYILVSHGAPIEPVSTWVPKTEASDHLPVVAEFRWKK